MQTNLRGRDLIGDLDFSKRRKSKPFWTWLGT
jgi:hypothetical protein